MKAALAPIARAPVFQYEVQYTFFADGTVEVSLDGTSSQDRPFLPRLGFQFQVAETEFSYFGYGPYESYEDMHHGSWVGLHQGNTDSAYVPYMKPQEHGSHWMTKMLTIGGFCFESTQGFCANVSAYSAEELTCKAHGFELEKDAFTNVRIDYKVSGLGSNSCGPKLAEVYQMKDETVHFAFTIRRKQ